MRIAIFTEVFRPKIDGITNRLCRTIECMVERGHEVVVFGPSDAVGEHAGARVVRVTGLPFPPYPGLRVALPDPRIAYELLRFRPEVVHAVGPVALGTWGLITARALGIPCVASYHTDLPAYARLYGLGWLEDAAWPAIRAIHNLASINLVPSTFTQAQLEERGVHRVGLWRGGVDAELFHPRRRSVFMRSRLSGSRLDSPILLYAGRLSPEKGLESLKEVLDAVPSATLALVGDGPARADLERFYRDDPVVFPGFLRGETLASAFASADAFVMPSQTETLGFVVLEAMASGCPVVAARAGGIPDLVEHRQNGLLYDPHKPGQLVERVRSALENPDRSRFLATQARKFAEEASWKNETRELVWTYRRAIRLERERSVLRKVPRLVFP